MFQLKILIDSRLRKQSIMVKLIFVAIAYNALHRNNALRRNIRETYKNLRSIYDEKIVKLCGGNT